MSLQRKCPAMCSWRRPHVIRSKNTSPSPDTRTSNAPFCPAFTPACLMPDPLPVVKCLLIFSITVVLLLYICFGNYLLSVKCTERKSKRRCSICKVRLGTVNASINALYSHLYTVCSYRGFTSCT